MATQSNIHFYVNWAKERLDEMEAGLASPEDKVGGEGILQKQMEQMATQSWSAQMAVLTETRAAFDHAN